MKVKIKATLIWILILFSLVSKSQEGIPTNWPNDDKKLLESANELFEEEYYSLAYAHYDKLLKKYPNLLYLKYLTGVSAIYISDKHNEAEKYLNDVKNQNKKTTFEIEYYFALLYHKTYQFDKAIELANKLIPNKKLNAKQVAELKKVIEYSTSGSQLVSKPINVDIQNIGVPPNSVWAEYSPVPSADEETMYFTYRGEKSKGGLRDLYSNQNKFGFYFEDVFYSNKVNGVWNEAKSIEKINTTSNDAVIAISNDGQSLFIFRASDTDGGDIYESKLEGDVFTEPKKLIGDINSNAWEGSISLSSNQKIAIFASERPGGFGGKDLYSARKQPDGSWGLIKNLGNSINTPLDDDAPFIHPDGKTLVFSSKGHNSMGGYDIFLSDMNETDSTWKTPVNIGYPVNTTYDDIFYVVSADGKSGYYASAKVGGNGDKDIYVVKPGLIEKKSELIVIKGKITENLKPVSSEIKVNYEDGQSFGIFKSNSISGNYLISLPTGSNYRLNFYDTLLRKEILREVNTTKGDGFTEKIININLGDTSATITPPIANETKDNPPPPTPEPTINNQTTNNKKNSNKKISKSVSAPLSVSDRAQLFKQYSSTKIAGLKFTVQVGAYRFPKNFKSDRLSKLGNVKEKGRLNGDIQLIIMDKEFDTWAEAQEFLDSVLSVGQNDAFITVSKDGKRYYIKDLLLEGIFNNATP